MSGKLYGIGVGPGDSGLLTLKGVEVLKKVDVIAFPKVTEKSESTAFKIVKEHINNNCQLLQLVLPMTSDKRILEESHKKAADEIVQRLNDGLDVAFITLGDPAIYSTYTYIHKRVENLCHKTEIIPGITSFSAGAAISGIGITEGDDVFSVIPATIGIERMERVMKESDSIVIMKVSANFNEVIELLKKENLLKNTIMVERCGMEGEKIIFDIESYQGSPTYFTTMIIKKNGCI